MIPNDDFGGFEPLRQQVSVIRISLHLMRLQSVTIHVLSLLSVQKPGFYEPKTDGVQ